MPRLAAMLLCLTGSLAACRSETGPAGVARVRVLAGNQPDPGMHVWAHTAEGDVIAEDVTDAVGIAELGVDIDALVTVQFTGDRTRLVTTHAPSADVTLEVHGPARPVLSPVVGVLNVSAPPLPSATYFEVDVGCSTIRATQFPDSFDVTSCSAGMDTTFLDVVIQGFHDVGAGRVWDGYAAGHIALLDGYAVLDVPAWKTTGPDLPIQNAVVGAEIDHMFFVDGNAYSGPPVIDNKAFYYDELEIDSSYVRARIDTPPATQIYELYGSGLYTFTVEPGRFLPPVELTTTRTGATYSWSSTPSGAEIAVLRVVDAAVTWEAILRADTTSITLPVSLEVDGTVSLSYMMTAPTFENLHDGVYATTIVKPAPTVDISTTRITGLL